MFRRILVVVALPLLIASVARADWTARMESKVEGEKDAGPVMSGRMFVRGDRVRVEIDQPMRQTTISDHAARKSWVIDDAAKAYTEIDLAKAGGAREGGAQCHGANVDECLKKQGFTRVGPAVANGRKCEIWERRSTEDGRPATTRLWRPTDVPFGFVRMVVTTADGGMTTDLHDLKEQAVDEALFKIPEGYAKRAMPGMPGAAMGAGGRTPAMSREQLEELMKKYGVKAPPAQQ